MKMRILRVTETSLILLIHFISLLQLVKMEQKKELLLTTLMVSIMRI